MLPCLLLSHFSPQMHSHLCWQLYDLLYGFSNEVIGRQCYGIRLGNLGNPTCSDDAARTPVIPEFLIRDFHASLISLFQITAKLQFGLPFYMYTAHMHAWMRKIQPILTLSMCWPWPEIGDAQVLQDEGLPAV